MATAPDTLLLMESCSLSGTITAGEGSDNSLRTLTSQSLLDHIISEPVISLIVDPIVTIEDLQKDVIIKQRATSSDNILSSTRRIKVGRDYSSMDAGLNDYTTIKQSVTQQAIDVWDAIIYYLTKHIISGRRQPPLRFKYYRNCFFGSEVISCLKDCLGHSIKDENNFVILCNKLLQSAVIEGIEESRGKLLFKSTELYRFTNNSPDMPKLSFESSQRRRFLPLGFQTSTMKAMLSIWKLWKKHVSTNQTPTYPLPPQQPVQQFRKSENHRNKTRDRIHSCQCTRHCLNRPLKKSASVNTLLEYKAGKSDWVVYGFL